MLKTSKLFGPANNKLFLLVNIRHNKAHYSCQSDFVYLATNTLFILKFKSLLWGYVVEKAYFISFINVYFSASFSDYWSLFTHCHYDIRRGCIFCFTTLFERLYHVFNLSRHPFEHKIQNREKCSANVSSWTFKSGPLTGKATLRWIFIHFKNASICS